MARAVPRGPVPVGRFLVPAWCAGVPHLDPRAAVHVERRDARGLRDEPRNRAAAARQRTACRRAAAAGRQPAASHESARGRVRPVHAAAVHRGTAVLGLQGPQRPEAVRARADAPVRHEHGECGRRAAAGVLPRLLHAAAAEHAPQRGVPLLPQLRRQRRPCHLPSTGAVGSARRCVNRWRLLGPARTRPHAADRLDVPARTAPSVDHRGDGGDLPDAGAVSAADGARGRKCPQPRRDSPAADGRGHRHACPGRRARARRLLLGIVGRRRGHLEPVPEPAQPGRPADLPAGPRALPGEHLRRAAGQVPARRRRRPLGHDEHVLRRRVGPEFRCDLRRAAGDRLAARRRHPDVGVLRRRRARESVRGLRADRGQKPEGWQLRRSRTCRYLVFIAGLGMAGPIFNTQTGIIFWLLVAAVEGSARTIPGLTSPEQSSRSFEEEAFGSVRV